MADRGPSTSMLLRCLLSAPKSAPPGAPRSRLAAEPRSTVSVPRQLWISGLVFTGLRRSPTSETGSSFFLGRRRGARLLERIEYPHTASFEITDLAAHHHKVMLRCRCGNQHVRLRSGPAILAETAAQLTASTRDGVSNGKNGAVVPNEILESAFELRIGLGGEAVGNFFHCDHAQREPVDRARPIQDGGRRPWAQKFTDDVGVDEVHGASALKQDFRDRSAPAGPANSRSLRRGVADAPAHGPMEAWPGLSSKP